MQTLFSFFRPFLVPFLISCILFTHPPPSLNLFVCVCECVCLCVYVCVCVCVSVCMYVCVCMCAYQCMPACVHACVHACVCMHACMCVCVSVCVCVCVRRSSGHPSLDSTLSTPHYYPLPPPPTPWRM